MRQRNHLHKLTFNLNTFHRKTLSWLSLRLFINNLTIPSWWLAFWFCNDIESDYTRCLKCLNLLNLKSSVSVLSEDYSNKVMINTSVIHFQSNLTFLNLIFFETIIHGVNNLIDYSQVPFFEETSSRYHTNPSHKYESDCIQNEKFE